MSPNTSKTSIYTPLDLDRVIKAGYFNKPKVGEKREVGGKDYVIAEDGSWRRLDKTVKQKRQDFRKTRKQRRKDANKSCES